MGGQGALWPMNIQLGLNIESALHHCIFNFCFSEMKQCEERARLFNFLDSKKMKMLSQHFQFLNFDFQT